jgi:hypothetical protein
MLRTSLLALLAGSAIGAWLLATEPAYSASRAGLREAHLTLLLFGWLAQFVLGVGYWMLPRHPVAPDRGLPWAGWLGYGLFLAGMATLPLRIVLPPDAITPAGRLLLAGAMVTFLFLLWPRARPFGAG